MWWGRGRGEMENGQKPTPAAVQYIPLSPPRPLFLSPFHPNDGYAQWGQRPGPAWHGPTWPACCLSAPTSSWTRIFFQSLHLALLRFGAKLLPRHPCSPLHLVGGVNLPSGNAAATLPPHLPQTKSIAVATGCVTPHLTTVPRRVTSLPESRTKKAGYESRSRPRSVLRSRSNVRRGQHGTYAYPGEGRSMGRR